MQALRDMPGNGTSYEQVKGNPELRRQIARWALNWDGRLTEDDLITTAGTMNAISFALMALTDSLTHNFLQPPAIAPTTRNGSVPFTTASGNGVSGGSSDRSSLHAKNRTNGRRFNVP